MSTENTDPCVLIMIYLGLVVLTIVAIVQDVRNRIDAGRGATDVEAVRGDKSMAAIFAVYGAGMASFLVLIGEATGIEGNKVILIVLAFVCLTYLFFVSTWFRNRVFFPLMGRVRKD